MLPLMSDDSILCDIDEHGNFRFWKEFNPDIATGYMRLSLNGTHHYVHTLMAEAFYGPRPKGLVINHKDGNKLNNHPDNLEYITQKQNVHHAIALGNWGVTKAKYK